MIVLLEGGIVLKAFSENRGVNKIKNIYEMPYYDYASNNHININNKCVYNYIT